MIRFMLALAISVGLAVPSAAQVPFNQLPEQLTLDPTQQVLVVDTTLADPIQQQRRMMLQLALDWVMANPAAAATDTLATLEIGGTVYAVAAVAAGGAATESPVSGDGTSENPVTVSDGRSTWFILPPGRSTTGAIGGASRPTLSVCRA